MEKSILKSLTSSKGLPILCVGDLILDSFVQGKVDRISPEAPIPVFHYNQEYKVLGGAGNVIRNLEHLDAPVHLVSSIGQDETAQEVRLLLQELPHVTLSLYSSPYIQTTQKTRFTASGYQLLRVDKETPNALSPECIEALKTLAIQQLKEASVLVLSDYGKGVLAHSLLEPLIQEAAYHKIPVIVDPKGHDYTRYKGATLLTPNRHELSIATNLPTETTEECIEAATKLLETLNIESILVTRGAQGMTYIPKKGEFFHVHAKARDVYDVAGAGDTVVAVLAACLRAQIDIHSSVELANLAGGIVVGKVGTAPVEKKDLMGALEEKPIYSGLTLEKEQSLSDLIEIRKLHHKKGLRVGFTNGCFDLLHPGHIYILEQTKSLCDFLIVGLNSDASIKRLKGETRPIQDQNSRSRVLAALACVDAIVLFEDDTPHQVITSLKPDVLVKGADYTLDQVVGAKEVLSWGGKVHLVDLVPDQSTTRLAQKGNAKN